MTEPNAFGKICERHLCDKTARWGHTYDVVYDPLLRELGAGRSKMRILEIGTGRRSLMCTYVGADYQAGAGSRVFRDFVMEELGILDVIVVTLDNDLKTVDEARSPKIIPMCVQNAYSIQSFIEFSNLISTPLRYDLIVDDGSHDPYDQAIFASLYPHLLRDEGRLVIEDINRTAAEMLPRRYKGTLVSRTLDHKSDNRIWVSEPHKRSD